jgi:hypothetical protein
VLFCTLFGLKLECAFFFYVEFHSTDASNHERIFVTVIFFSHMQYKYVNILNYLKFLMLGIQRHHLEELFLLNVYNGSKFCPDIL